MMKLFKFFLWLFGGAIIASIGFLIYIYSEIRHDIKPLVEYEPKLTTTIYDRNGKLIANLFEEHRIYATIDEIPGRLIEALVAIEDTKFYEHNGINFDAIIRAAIKVIQARAFVEGASTITQQLIKTKILTRDKKIMRKIKEALLALRLETILTKDQILERYLNEIYFGHGYYGVKTAAKGYFNKELRDLNLKEIAMLVSLPRAPSYYDPTKRYEENLRRANSVITRMRNLGWIDEKEYLEAIQMRPAVYDQTLSQNKAPYVVDQVLRTINYEDIRSGGYVIETTIDLATQELATQALRYGYEQILARDVNATGLNGAIVVMQKESGDILAMVGGIDYQQSNFNRAVQSRRQSGSSFKPFIYQSALNLGYSTASVIPDVARTYEFQKGNEELKWQPQNYGRDFAGLVTLKDALVFSKNLATINLVQSIGFNNLKRELEPLHIDIPPNLSVALGNVAVSPLQMVEFYSAFINYGNIVEPRIVSKVYKDGKVIKEFNTKKRFYTSSDQAYLMIDILKEVVDRGTGRSARVSGIELAGKTGTTNDNVDTWFCGFSPTVQAVVWYGRDDNQPIGKNETGGQTAAPAFRYFFENYIKLYPEIDRRFMKPKGVMRGVVDGVEYLYTETSKLPSRRHSVDDSLIF